VSVFENPLRHDLEGAVSRGEVVAYFQPQVDLKSGSLVAAEALARWNHPTRGQLLPADFVALAEETELIHEIGRYMLEQCLDAVGEWHNDPLPLEISVNVSPAQLAHAEFSDHLAAELTRRPLPQDSLTIEITERLPIIDRPEVAVRLGQLRGLGLGVAIDDFGVGHATAEQLDALPVTELKLDRTLLHDDRPAMEKYLGQIIEHAHERELRIVAEGVETPVHLNKARALGCDRGQGYLFGRAMPREQFELIRGHRAPH
jgi:EAL domain-containing protein (putative c-di-GMP-specific phosphodiesterase class I)